MKAMDWLGGSESWVEFDLETMLATRVVIKDTADEEPSEEIKKRLADFKAMWFGIETR